MADSAIVSWILNATFGVIMFLMKQAQDRTREDIKKHDTSIELLKENKLAKSDFKEFKEELWKRFDRLEEVVTKKE